MHLAEAQALELLSAAGTVYAPQAVVAEFAQLRPDARPPSWLQISSLSERAQAEAMTWFQAGLLDPGEAEAIAPAREIGAHWLLTDDAAARLIGTQLGLEVHGSLGIILRAAADHRLDRDAARAMLDRLRRGTLWISARVFREAEEALERLFS